MLTILFPSFLGFQIAYNLTKPWSENAESKEMEYRSENIRAIISTWQRLGALPAISVVWLILLIGMFQVLENIAPERYSSVRDVLSYSCC
jgi:hypothetical protein